MHIAIVEAFISLVTAALTAGGLPAVLGLMAVESFGIPPIPGEVVLVFSGFLVASGSQSFLGVFAAALGGSLIGSYGAYAVGRHGRRFITGDVPSWRRVDPRHLAAMEGWFDRWGDGTVALARLVPLVRAYVSYPAGTARLPPVRFGAYTALGAAPFIAALEYAGLVLGSNWQAIVPWFTYFDDAAVAFLVALPVYVALRWRGIIGPGFPPRPTARGPTPPDGSGPL
jgi:membrane protein DedA with SNARE-associated domain